MGSFSRCILFSALFKLLSLISNLINSRLRKKEMTHLLVVFPSVHFVRGHVRLLFLSVLVIGVDL